ncbi:hypothetical protein C8F01DRAFT_39383 [Mycena amicta]|nr:hypothetical protein C8F01DRAFT_39383 [Mycena amicta]
MRKAESLLHHGHTMSLSFPEEPTTWTRAWMPASLPHHTPASSTQGGVRELAPPWPHYPPVVAVAVAFPSAFPVSIFISEKPYTGALFPAPKLVHTRPRVFRPPPIGTASHKQTSTSSSMSSVPSATHSLSSASEEGDPDEPFRFIPSLLERFPSLRYSDHISSGDDDKDSRLSDDDDEESELGEDEERVNVLDWVRMHAPQGEVESTCYDDETRKIALAEWATGTEMEWNDDGELRNQDLALALAETWVDVCEEDYSELGYAADDERLEETSESDEDSESEKDTPDES